MHEKKRLQQKKQMSLREILKMMSEQTKIKKNEKLSERQKKMSACNITLLYHFCVHVSQKKKKENHVRSFFFT